MKVYKSGTLIRIKLSNQEAYISEIIIGYGYVFYKVSYFFNGDLKLATLSEFEFDVIGDSSKKTNWFQTNKIL